jgi:ureidoacrylate peracid hydrolase
MGTAHQGCAKSRSVGDACPTELAGTTIGRVGVDETLEGNARNEAQRSMKRTQAALRRISLIGMTFAFPAIHSGCVSPRQGTGDSRAGRRITLPAQPEPMSIDTARTALIVVDMQNDFGSKGGMFDRAGIDISGIQKAVGPTARVLASARKAGIKVIYLKMAFRPDLSDAGPPDSPARINHLERLNVGKIIKAPNGTESRILIRDTWNTDILEELSPKPGDVVIYKNRFSGFYQTELDAVLKRMAIRHLVVTGCTTSVCVDSTIRDAVFRDYRCVLLADCTAEPIGQGLPRSNYDASLLSRNAESFMLPFSGERRHDRT